MTYATKSPWVIHYDGSSCNGCDIEVLAALCPGFDVERFGIINTGNPKHADIFLVTGSVNEQNIGVVQEIYNQMVEPKVVIACGICACSAGIFHDCYNVIGGVMADIHDVCLHGRCFLEERQDGRGLETPVAIKVGDTQGNGHFEVHYQFGVNHSLSRHSVVPAIILAEDTLTCETRQNCPGDYCLV